MQKLTMRGYAKLNLALNITGRRDNGYHDMQMIMQTVDLYDEITISLNRSGFVGVETSNRHIPSNADNIAYKAAQIFFSHAKWRYGAEIYIQKKIPYQAGLAGGSADAAAVLTGLNQLFDCPLSQEKLIQISLAAGADVPFSILGGTALATGVGEELTPFPSLPACHIVIAKPDKGISTAEAFARYDCTPLPPKADIALLQNALKEKDLSFFASNMYNVFEELVTEPSITKLKEQMLEQGALGSIMTGSGSAVFGIFDTLSLAQQCYDTLRQSTAFCCITQPIAHGAAIRYNKLRKLKKG